MKGLDFMKNEQADLKKNQMKLLLISWEKYNTENEKLLMGLITDQTELKKRLKKKQNLEMKQQNPSTLKKRKKDQGKRIAPSVVHWTC